MTSREALEELLGRAMSKPYVGMVAAALEKDLDKLDQYETIEKELGIDLITLFKALKNGFYAYEDNHIVKMKSHKGNCGAMSFYASYDCIIAEDVFEQQYIYLLKDYRKTWSLDKKELENETR